MKSFILTCCALALAEAVSASPVASPALPSKPQSKHLRYERTVSGSFADGQPDNGKGKGGPLLGGTNKYLDKTNPANLGQEPTDSGSVVNLKWSFSDSKTRLLNGGWTRQQVVTDLPASHDIAAAQQHLKKGAIREMHWHRVSEWGYVYAGRILFTGVDEHGRNQASVLHPGDIWYIPKGGAHSVQGLDDENEFLLAFDDGNFDSAGTTFMVDDWIAHTPKDIILRNFGLPANSTAFDKVPSPNPYITNATVGDITIDSPFGSLEDSTDSWVYYGSKVAPTHEIPGGGNVRIIDSHNFPIAKTIATSIVTLKPGALRELHWHPNAEEWLFFSQGTARVSVFMGGAAARTFDFTAGDTAVMPDNSGHYVENTGDEDLVWIELYKSDRVADISLTQWLALTPVELVSQILKVDASVVANLKKEKQLILPAVSN